MESMCQWQGRQLPNRIYAFDGERLRSDPMELRTVVAAAVFMACIPSAIAEPPVTAEAYDVKEAYEVYSVLLPREESYGFSKGTLVIQQDMLQEPLSYSS